uniref:N(4)-(Beta-N-acetylglucosaminyl)-L-asparaginase n=1 Tax=Eptatretus burgeri TaxID=7764 RepID=A0A8C4NGB0_EPTBU
MRRSLVALRGHPCCFIALLVFCRQSWSDKLSLPLVLNTWHFPQAASSGWNELMGGGSVLDAVHAGCAQCEVDACDGTVGPGGSPDDHGETTLDAMIMDGDTYDVGAVAGLRRVPSAIGVARAIMDHTTHTLLVGEAASRFAVSMGFPDLDLTSNRSRKIFTDWLQATCQPNFYKNVVPNPTKYCGPYKPLVRMTSGESRPSAQPSWSRGHDTVGMLAVDGNGHIAVATSSNGAVHKISGRVGDSPIPGAGGYAVGGVGGAVATGDGDTMIRFLPSYQAVESMRRGMSPRGACRDALARIQKVRPGFFGALVCANTTGNFGAACSRHGSFTRFTYMVCTATACPAAHTISCE